MNLAVIELSSQYHGVSSYSRHAGAGLKTVGLCGHVITFAEPVIRIAHADRVVRWARAAEVMGEYDGVILSDARERTYDGRAVKRFETPWYIDALIASQVPWSSTLRDRAYTEWHAPFLPDLVRQSKCAGFVTAGVDFVLSNLDVNVAVDNKLPLSWARPVSLPSAKKVGAAGGWMGLMAALPLLPIDWQYEVYGPLNRESPFIFSTLAMQYGIKSFAWATGETIEQRDLPKHDKTPWTVVLKTGHSITFREQGVFDLPNPPRVFINLRASPSVVGTLGYAGLEALSLGCMLVTAPHMLSIDDGIYSVFELDAMPEEPVLDKVKGFKTGRHIDYASSLARAVESAMSTEHAAGIAETNWRALERHHSPIRHARLHEELHRRLAKC